MNRAKSTFVVWATVVVLSWAAATPAGADQVKAELLAAERLYWESVKDSEHPAEIRTYLEQYPNGLFAPLARTRLKRLSDAAAPPAPDAKSTGEASAQPEAKAGASTPPAQPEAQPALRPEAVEEALGLGPDDRRLMQSGLASLGFDPGSADGVFGRRTRAAIGAWQKSVGIPATGYLDAGGARTLAKKGIAAPPPGKKKNDATRAAMQTLGMAIRAAGKIKAAFLRAEVLREIGEVLAKARDDRRAARTFALAVEAAEKSEYGRSGALVSIAKAQAAAGDLRGASSTAERIRDERYLGWALMFIARAQAAASNSRQALATAERAPSLEGRAEVLAAVAKAQIEVGDKSGAALTIERALETAERIADEDDRDNPFQKISGAQLAAGDIQQAVATARRIASPTARSEAFRSIFEAQAEAGDVEGSRRSLKSALAAAGQEGKSYLRVGDYTRIAEAQAKFGDASGARRTLDLALAAIEERQEGERAHSLAFFAGTLADFGRTEDAARLIERVLVTAEQLESDDKRDSAISVIAYAHAAIAEAHKKAGAAADSARSFEAAFATVKRIRAKDKTDDALGWIAKAQVRTGDITAALATTKRMDPEYEQASALVNIARAQLGE